MKLTLVTELIAQQLMTEDLSLMTGGVIIVYTYAVMPLANFDSID